MKKPNRLMIVLLVGVLFFSLILTSCCIFENNDDEPTPFPPNEEIIEFGEYPQSIKEETVEITSSKDSRGYFLGSDGCYYAKVSASLNANPLILQEGSLIEEEGYYFKVEPIKWRILSSKASEAIILCESIIASKEYFIGPAQRKIEGETIYKNNYKYSDIRTWLNEDFYDFAFNATEKKLILNSNVDNSPESTGFKNNPNACPNTLDKVFLLSCMDMQNTQYGFNASPEKVDKAKQKPVTDYARETGTFIYTEEDFYGNGIYWLRSPFKETLANKAYAINYDGSIGSEGNIPAFYVDDEGIGIVPALKIRIS